METFLLFVAAAIAVAVARFWLVEAVAPTPWDLAGTTIALGGMALITFQPDR